MKKENIIYTVIAIALATILITMYSIHCYNWHQLEKVEHARETNQVITVVHTHSNN